MISDSSSQRDHREKMDTQRLARQDLLRRRDISLYTGLHPRLLHGNAGASIQGQQPQQPRLSLLKTSTPCRAFPCAQQPPQMPSPASFGLGGLGGLESPEGPKGQNYQNLGAKAKKCIKKPPPEELSDEDEGEAEDGVLPAEFFYDDSSRRSSLKDSDELFPTSTKCKTSSTLDEILGIQPESGIFSDDSIRVYRAEIPSPKLEQVKLENVEKPEKPQDSQPPLQPQWPQEPPQVPQPQSKSDILLG